MDAKVESFGKQLREVLEAADKLLESGVDKSEALRKARAHLHSACESLGGKARAVDHAVHEHPWRAIAATGLVAFLLGLLVRRR